MTHPAQLGKYVIEGVLGTGAMGTVYEATDPGIRRRVALKTIRRSLVESDGSGAMVLARFRNEAQAAGRLSHPGIVSIYDYGEEGDTAFIAMELVEGYDLARILQVSPIMAEPMLLQVMDQLLEALDYAHERGVWHRDIKPANLVFTRSGQLKITDFGVARIRDASLTQVTSVIGTHGYMSPEQYKGLEIDHRVDIFAAGALLYRLLTGQGAFAGGSPEEIMYKVLHEEPAAPSTLSRVKRGIQVDVVVSTALAKEVHKRYPSAGAFREALRVHAARPAQAGGPAALAATASDDTVVETQIMRSPYQPLWRAAGGAGWSDEVLNMLERALASFLGPLAKMLVKQAAAGHGEFDALAAALAKHLPTPDERERFMAKVRQAGAMTTGSQARPDTANRPVATGASTGGPASGAMPTGPTGATLIDPAFVAHALRTLTTYMGPMAKVVLKKAQAQARDGEQLVELLVTHCADGVDREGLRKALQQGPSGSKTVS